MSRPTYAQIEALVDFLETHPGIAKGLLKSAHAKTEIKKKWAAFAVTANSLGGAIKDGQAWAKYWAEKKCAIKKQCSKNAASMRCTGGGTDNLPVLSELDRRLVAVMGGQQFATGDLHLMVDPLSQLETTSQTTTADENLEMLVVEELPSQLNISPTPTPKKVLNQTPPRIHRSKHRPSNVDITMERLAQLEERRIEAENATATAFQGVAKALTQSAVAQQNIADALKDISNALEAISNKISLK